MSHSPQTQNNVAGSEHSPPDHGGSAAAAGSEPSSKKKKKFPGKGRNLARARAARKIQLIFRAYNSRNILSRLRLARAQDIRRKVIKIQALVRGNNARLLFEHVATEDECEEPETCGICLDATEGLVSDCGICSTKFCKPCIFQHQVSGTGSPRCPNCRQPSLWKRRGQTVVLKPPPPPPRVKHQCCAFDWHGGGIRKRCKTMRPIVAEGDEDTHFCIRHTRLVERRGKVVGDIDGPADPAVRYDAVRHAHEYNGLVSGSAMLPQTHNDWFRVLDDDGAKTVVIIQGFCEEDELDGETFGPKYAAIKEQNPGATWLTLAGKLGGRRPALQDIFDALELTVGRPSPEWCLANTHRL